MSSYIFARESRPGTVPGKKEMAQKKTTSPGFGETFPLAGHPLDKKKNTTFNGPETGVVFYCCFNGSVFFCITWKCWHAAFSNVFFGAWYAFFRKAIIVPTQHTTSGVGSIHHLSPWPASEAGTSSDVFHPPNLETPPFTAVAPWQYSLCWPTNDWRAASEVPKPKVGRQKIPGPRNPTELPWFKAWSLPTTHGSQRKAKKEWLHDSKKCRLPKQKVHNLKLSKIRRNWTRNSPTPPRSCQGFSCFFFPRLPLAWKWLKASWKSGIAETN